MSFRTQRDVDRLSLPPGKLEHVEFDEACRGLGVRLQGGSRVWLVRYQVPGGTRRKITLGDVAGISLAEARKRAAQITGGAKDGQDPQQQRKERADKRADTFGALVGLYLARYAAREQRPRTLVETTRALLVHLAPLHNRPLAEITRRDVAGTVMALVDSSGPIASNRTRAALSHCFAWAVQQGLADNNPVIGTARPAPEVKRERVLSDDELRAVWLAAGDHGYGRIIKLLILTGQRRDEVGRMAEAELDRERSLWVLPAARTKNAREHEVPLAPLTLSIIGDFRPGRTHIFGRGSGGFNGWAQAKAELDRRIVATGAAMPPWVIHDLRRTVVTQMNEDRHPTAHRRGRGESLGGVGKAGVGGVYNHARYRPEKKAALERWAVHVESVVLG